MRKSRFLSLFLSKNPLNPLTLGNSTLWLDGADTSTITADGSNFVSQVNDKSGNGANATATGTTRPLLVANALNGRSVLDFDGGDDALIINQSFSGTYTKIIVLARDVTTIGFYFGNSGTTQKDGQTTTPAKFNSRVVSTLDQTQDYPTATGVYGYIINRRDADNKVDVFLNSTTPVRLFSDVAQSGAHAINRIADDNAGNNWNGKIAEVIMYSTALSNDDVANLANNYLKPKWAI